jgi:hypothetical protein
MFEKEVMISGLKKNSRVLAELVEELESKNRFSDEDILYCHTALKKIETDLRKIRKMDEEMQLVTRAW